MKKIISIFSALAIAAIALTGTAKADERISLIATSPVPLSTATTTNTGIGISYAVVKIGPRLEIAPFATVTNLKNKNVQVQPGLEANLLLWNRVVIGIG